MIFERFLKNYWELLKSKWNSLEGIDIGEIGLQQQTRVDSTVELKFYDHLSLQPKDISYVLKTFQGPIKKKKKDFSRAYYPL